MKYPATKFKIIKPNFISTGRNLTHIPVRTTVNIITEPASVLRNVEFLKGSKILDLENLLTNSNIMNSKYSKNSGSVYIRIQL